MVPEFHVENKGLTLNGHTVPVVTKRMILSDTLSLSISLGVRLPDSLELDLLSFGPSGDMSWLCKSLTVPDNNPGRWWAYCSVRLPLLTEIRESIKNLHVWKRQYQHLKDHIIPLLIRGQILYVDNNSAVVTLGFTKVPSDPGPHLDILSWFCSELQKDIDANAAPHATMTLKSHYDPEEHGEIVQTIINRLVAHPQALQVLFDPAKMAFQIYKKSLHGIGARGKALQIPVLGINFQMCLSMGLKYLDAPEDACAP